MAYEDVFLMPISIHAPARGATPAGAKAVLAVQNFNSRPCERGDGLRAGQDFIQHYFNSRPCERGDLPLLLYIVLPVISIHAPARGATLCHDCLMDVAEISIHAPARGATRGRGAGGAMCAFQFTPLREGRPARKLSKCSAPLFQFTPLREGRRQN